MPKLINWGLIAHPINWLTITLMVIIGMIALNIILTPWHSPTTSGLSANSTPGPDLATSQ